MLGFYRTVAYTLLCLIISTALLLFFGEKKTNLRVPILPVQKGSIPWTKRLVPESPADPAHKVMVNEDHHLLDWDFILTPDTLYPYASYSLDFTDIAQPNLLDWTRYDGFSFRVQCSPQNVMVLALFTRDEMTTVQSDHATYRPSSVVFPCSEKWNTVDIGFEDLYTHDWWLNTFERPLTDRNPRLDQVFGLGFINSLRSPRATPSNIKIADLHLTGQDSRYWYIAVAVVALLWLLSFIWLFRRYIAALVVQVQENVKRDLPLMAYQKLTIEPRADKEKTDVISFLATEYANPDLDLDAAVSTLGINRNKINDILKSEIGLTFSGYLNKLRLTEAARLLLEQKDVNVAQIAYGVGYNNVTYFNKLFKNEYGCTPKIFKTLYQTAPQGSKD